MQSMKISNLKCVIFQNIMKKYMRNTIDFWLIRHNINRIRYFKTVCNSVIVVL